MNSDDVNPIEELIITQGAERAVSTVEDWRAAREQCALLPATHRAIVRATGDDAESFLHGMLTNDVRGLEVGSGRPAAFLTDTGKVVSDLRVYRDKEGFDLDCVSWRCEHLCGGLDKYIIADDVELERLDGRAALASLEGPGSMATAADALRVPELEPFGSCQVDFDGRALTLHAVSDLGATGVLVVGPLESRDAVLAACQRAGARPVGLATLQVLRVEAGVPWAGVDMGEDTLLMEIGLPETISRTKGCYLGQEVVERVSARGQVNRTLTAFSIDAELDRIPAGRCEVRNEAGAEVGRITSRVESRALGGVLGLGLLHRKGHDASALNVTVGDASYPCRVTEFPGVGRAR